MQDKTINSILRHLYKQEEYREHATALLVIRGVDLPKICTPRYKCFARGELRQLVLGALSNGPKRGGEIVAYCAARKPDMPRHVLQNRLSVKLWKLKQKGWVCRDRRLWRLAPQGQP